MSIKWIGAAWQSNLATGFPQDHRTYIDFRQQQYTEVVGSPTFTLITSADNQPGSHNFTGGYANYLLDMPPTLTFDIYFKPTFSYTGGTNQYLWSWYNDATHQLSFYFDVVSHTYILNWQDGGTNRTMGSSAYANDVTFQVWTRTTFSIDLTTGTNAGSAFYLQGSSVATTWSGVSDVKARYFPTFSIRGRNSTAGAYTINYARMYSVTSTAAEVSANFSAKKDEEIVWHFNGCALGHTRCSVTSRTLNCDIERSATSPAGQSSSNFASIVLLSPQGQFADDQYSAFNAASEIYNGTSSQSFLKQRCPLEIETWYGGLFELEFTGRIDDNVFKRRSQVYDISRVTIHAYDLVDELKRRVRQKAYSFDSYSLCDPSSTATSLVHAIAGMGYPEWYNFLGNSSFENATIGNSWLVAGAGASIAKVAGGLMGGSQCDLTYGAATANLYQIITFTGNKKLNVGQKWTAFVYLKAGAAAAGNIYLYGYAGAGLVETTSTAYSLTGGEGWRRYSVTYTIANSTVNTLRFSVSTNASISFDCAMVIQNGQALNWFIVNSNDGTAGTISADNALSSTYATFGFDVDDAMITHPYAIVEQGVPIWNYLSQIADATAARYMGCDACGTLKYRTPFKAGYADPAALATISNIQSVDANLTIDQANKIVIHGAVIMKNTGIVQVWSADKTAFFTRDAAGYLYETVTDGSVWPFTRFYNDFWASYDTTPGGQT
jgi:hypothetical protein